LAATVFRIKICGITNRDDAQLVADAGGDAVGLNFFASSPRFIDFEAAGRIAAALPKNVAKVGLFVNATAATVCDAFDRLGLDLIQLHGDEPAEYLVQLGGRPVMRAFRLGEEGLSPVTAYLAKCQALNAMPKLVLLDAKVPGEYGGTGKTTDWAVAADYAQRPGLPPLVLAGGLTPLNVAEAIRTVRPAAVDTASGVESSPGRKDPALVKAFIQAARNA
jgi:phosphoribosylanthranilate isomerase